MKHGSGLLSAMVALASIVPACGDRLLGGSPGTGGAGSAGAGGERATAGTTGTDGGVVRTDGESRRDDDAGSCQVDGGNYFPGHVATGRFSGPDLDGTFCGQNVYLGRSGPNSPLALSSLDWIATSAQFAFDTPATPGGGGSLAFEIGIPSVATATYDSADTCGYVQLIASFPVVPGVSCAFPPGGLPPGQLCPTGCAISGGPSSDEGCQPIFKVFSFEAYGPPDDCLPQGPQVSKGSWTLALAAAGPQQDSGALETYESHGTLTATLVGGKEDADAGTSTLDLTLTF